MKKIILHTAVAGSLALLMTTAAFGGGFQLNEHGASAMAQGGAFAARATDPSAIYFNPAGLGFQHGVQAYLGATFIMPKVSFFGPVQNNVNTETKMVDQTFTPINAYVTYEVTDNIHVGFGVNNPFGLGTKWPDNWAGKYISTEVDLQSFFFTPTVAYKISDQFSVGGGFNYATGNVTIKRQVQDNLDPSATIDLKLSGTGAGFNVGALYKFSNDLSVGASYRSSVKIDASGTATFTPNRSVYPGGDASSSLELPATGFIGIAYAPMEHLSLEADYQYIGWSSYKDLTITFKKDNSQTVSPKNYQNTYILRVGGEYTWNEFRFRAGYLYDHSPVLTEYVEPLLPDANRNGLNVGVGYQVTKELSVDVAYMFLKFDQRKATNTAVNFDGTYNANANLLSIDLGYSF